jgi:hypothetical protein
VIERCASPIAFETLVAYWADDLDPTESDAVEEHVMGCASCAAASARVAAVATAIRAQIPPVVSREGVAKLRARGLRVVENPVRPGERKLAVLSPEIDILLHRLMDLDLSRATSVAVTVSVEETGDVIMHSDDVPFDRDSGEILIPCHKHFAAFPPNVVFGVRTRDESGAESVVTYTVPHAFG